MDTWIIEDRHTEPEMPRYEITHGASATQVVVIQTGSKIIIQTVKPMTIPAGESFTITQAGG